LAKNNKSPFIAGLLSLIIPGSGQAYNGQIKKGIVIFSSTVAIWFIYSTIYAICLLFYGLTEGEISIVVIVVPLLIPLLINIIAAFDAIKKAELRNKGGSLSDWFD
jgi:ABC-type transport system involved in cytochrome c biogenesis permease component